MLNHNSPIHFYRSQVESVGQPIGLIVADDVTTARRAAKLVKVQYEKLPAILTLEVCLIESSLKKKK